MKTPIQVRNYLVIISIFFLVVTVISLCVNIDKTSRQYKQLATVMGRSFFEAFIAARMWNAQHNGVYVPVTDDLKPNPYLDDPLRDVITKDGTILTKINPAFMTRLISEILKKGNGLNVNITSLNPIRPENKADAWERNALESFSKGSKEEFGIVGEGASAVFRYMSPLRTEKACLKCHAKQGYREGDIRGGISVTFSYGLFQTAVSESNMQIFLIHILFFSTGVLIIYLLGKKLNKRVVDLQGALQHIKKLEGMLPICANCKKIRMEGKDSAINESWVSIERYIGERTDATFTHGICPECIKKLYPDLD